MDNIFARRNLIIVGLLLLLTAVTFGAPESAFAATITVTGTADDANVANLNGNGTCDLREAIQAANTNAAVGECTAGAVGADTIEFNIAGGGVHTISPLAALPTITEAVTIDGTTQAGTVCPTALMIELNGTGAGFGANGISISTSGSLVRGLIINRFPDSGIQMIGAGADANTIQCNWLGTDNTGLLDQGNGGNGVVMVNGADNNLIGTDGDGVIDTEERNIISGNELFGVRIDGNGGSTGNIVAGNYIGVDVTGIGALGNGHVTVATDYGGVLIFISANNRIGTDGSNDAFNANERNVIGNTIGKGIEVLGPGTNNNVIAGNYIGLNAASTIASNTSFGIFIETGPQATRIGTNGDGIADVEERNVISGNQQSGVGISGQFGGAGSTIIAGNFIGTDATGTAAIGNLGAGIVLASGSANNRIGTDGNGIADAAEGNVISGNGASFSPGIALNSAGTSNNVIAGNYIGVAADGVSALGNLFNGIQLGSGASNNRIGSNNDGTSDALEGNIIANHPRSGIQVNTGSVGINISRNSIYNNGAVPTFIGIDLTTDPNGNGPTLNDVGDGDGGPNNQQNFPMVFNVIDTGTLEIQGALNSTANTSFRVEFFANTTCHATGFGEGRTFIGQTTVLTDAGGNANIAVLGLPVTAGQTIITATATDPTGNTSEFSRCDELPTVINTLPLNGATNVAVNSSITIDFSEAVNLGANAFTLECPVGTPITFITAPLPPGGVSSFTLTPNANLPNATACTVTVTAAQVSDLSANNMLANYVFSFTTVAAVAPPGGTTGGGTGGGGDNPPALQPAVTFSDQDFIIKSEDKTLAKIGETVTYTLVFGNPKPITLTNVIITDVFDARFDNVTLVSTSIGTGSLVGNTLTISGFELLSGQTMLATITVQVSNRAKAGDVIANFAQLESPDASVHISNTVYLTILPDALPQTGGRQ